MKELRIMCLAVIVVAGILNVGAALLGNPHPAEALTRLDLGQRALASNP